MRASGRARVVLVLLAAAIMDSACSTSQVHSSTPDDAISLEARDIERGGVALITSSAATGQEQDRQALALIFGHVFMKE